MDRAAWTAVALIAVPVLAGCLGAAPAGTDTGARSPDAGATEALLPDTIAGIEPIGPVPDVESAGGIWPDGDHLYAAGNSNGFYTIDVTDPANASLRAQIDETRTGDPLDSRDVALVHLADRTVAVLASSGDGMHVVNVTDPDRPEHLATVLGGGLDADGSNGNVHNVAVVPNSTIVYNSRSADTPGVDIVDVSDPSDPERVDVFGDLTCHDVSFHPPDGLAYCAGVRETQVWDVTTPRHPEVLGRIVNPAIQIHHAAIPARGGDLLIVLDEFAGSTAAAAGCFAEEDGRSDPVGAAWFYDVSDPAAPEPLGWIAPDVPIDNAVGVAPCTAHFGTVVGEGRDLAVIGWRTAGTYLVDFSDPMQPRFVDSIRGDVEVWEARYHRGFAYTGDTARGVDVLGFVGT